MYNCRYCVHSVSICTIHVVHACMSFFEIMYLEFKTADLQDRLSDITKAHSELQTELTTEKRKAEEVEGQLECVRQELKGNIEKQVCLAMHDSSHDCTCVLD